ncbi:tetratricopeptide repeat protein [Erwinia sp. JH02]|uniref:tetratricopeptide repeat protein n=1 Tax=Erwinia sp. JH02 TaxID=2733394 RepID=UPI001489E920|nr:tetratricopeptide repeat protein [Erwinia sp. JH02]NNS07301.1 hypothetical protein [Erwinia sp. JH02]
MDEGRGLIGFAGLTDWWDYVLSPSDRAAISQGYHPLGGGDNLDSGYTERYDSKGKLSSQISIFNSLIHTDCPYEVKKKIADKALEIASSGGQNAIDLHFLFHSIIAFEYKQRDLDPGALGRAIKACESQISIATKVKSAFKKNLFKDGFLPSHPGFKQLAIIFEKQKNYKKAIKLCEKALSQGWSGDWQSRIDRCIKKSK